MLRPVASASKRWTTSYTVRVAEPGNALLSQSLRTHGFTEFILPIPDTSLTTGELLPLLGGFA